MHPGDCVLQPPQIRHRVLESSAGLEVLEISCPAEHETWADADLDLPTTEVRPTVILVGRISFFTKQFRLSGVLANGRIRI